MRPLAALTKRQTDRVKRVAPTMPRMQSLLPKTQGNGMNRFKQVLLAPLLAGLLVPLVAVAADGVLLGFSTNANTEGSADAPNLASIEVSGVGENSPAQAADLRVGDRLLSANGKSIPGAPVADFMQIMQGLNPGDHLLLQVRRTGSPTPVQVEIIAAAK